MHNRFTRLAPLLPTAAAIAAAALLGYWWGRKSDVDLKPRLPGTDLPPGMTDATGLTNAVLAGKLIPGDGKPADLPGAWPSFRGPNRDGISPETTALARSWDASGPRQLWAIDVGEGYAGAAVHDGRVYVMDYDREKKLDALRCLSLADNREIWRYVYPVSVKRNHGMSRTVPAVTDKFVVAMGPKCHVVCCDAVTGELKWGLDLVRQYGATVPDWYAGQCPLIEGGAVILAPGGTNALLMALEIESGKERWRTPNPDDWKMTHSSVVPMEFTGQRIYVYCAKPGVVGVAASDGALLWRTTEWKIAIATIPSPVPLPDGRIFLSGGYDAGSLMLQLKKEGDRFTAQKLFKLDPIVFGATQHTPILRDGHLYGIRPDGQFVCLDLNGKPQWASGPANRFGLGPFLVADGLIYALSEKGRLCLIEATPTRFNLLAQAQVLHGREAWGPLALAGGRLIARDLTRMVCLDAAAR